MVLVYLKTHVRMSLASLWLLDLSDVIEKHRSSPTPQAFSPSLQFYRWRNGGTDIERDFQK